MKLQIKILLANCLLTLIIAFISQPPEGIHLQFFGYFGMTAVIMGILTLLISIVLLIAKSEKWGQGFLLSAGVLLIVGFATCSTLFH